MDKRLKVHNNFISAVSNKMHKLDLIHRLKKSEPHNAVHYQRQLDQHLFDVHEAVSRVATEVDILERHMR